MKIRQGFVSNSSSSSFVVSLDKITAKDALTLMDYPGRAGLERDSSDGWSFTVDKNRGFITGWTSMDNGDLSEYCKKHGINDSLFQWEDLS